MEYEVIDLSSLPGTDQPREYKHDAVCRAAMELPLGKGIVVDRNTYQQFVSARGYKRRFPELQCFKRAGRFILARKAPVQEEEAHHGHQDD